MEPYIKKIEKGIKQNAVIVMGCECEIDYSGRAESHLPMGERLIVIKSDNTLIVHQPEGNAPVNYMKPDTKHSVVFENGDYYLKSKNQALKEYLDVKIKNILFVNSSQLRDGQKIQLAGSEKDMSEMIYNNPLLIGEDFKPLSMEEHTKYGFIDVFGHDSKNNLVIVECKRYIGDLNAVQQLRRYVEKIKKLRGIENVRGILACPKMSPNAEQMLHDWGFEFVSITPPKYRERFDKKQQTLEGF